MVKFVQVIKALYKIEKLCKTQCKSMQLLFLTHLKDLQFPSISFSSGDDLNGGRRNFWSKPLDIHFGLETFSICDLRAVNGLDGSSDGQQLPVGERKKPQVP